MKRIHLFEFMDLDWYPQTFRRIQGEYLQFVATLGSGHQNLIPFFKKALCHRKDCSIVDLCSGSSGPWARLYPLLQQAGLDVKLTLTDKYPDPDSLKRYLADSQPGITVLPEPVDALNVPRNLEGMRTLFEGFHHFKPEKACKILQDASDARQPIAVFEAGLKAPFRLPLLVLAPITTILGYFFMTPFIKPRNFSRFFWTYLIPIVPLATCWDGVVSLLRVYPPESLQALCDTIQAPNYAWEIGLVPTGTQVFDFIYLVGYPLD